MSLFTYPKLSDDEKIQGFSYNQYQLAILRIELYTIAEQLISLEIEGDNFIDFAKQHAFLTGQRQLLQTLISRSEEVSSFVNNLSADSSVTTIINPAE